MSSSAPETSREPRPSPSTVGDTSVCTRRPFRPVGRMTPPLRRRARAVRSGLSTTVVSPARTWTATTARPFAPSRQAEYFAEGRAIREQIERPSGRHEPWGAVWGGHRDECGCTDCRGPLDQRFLPAPPRRGSLDEGARARHRASSRTTMVEGRGRRRDVPGGEGARRGRPTRAANSVAAREDPGQPSIVRPTRGAASTTVALTPRGLREASTAIDPPPKEPAADHKRGPPRWRPPARSAPHPTDAARRGASDPRSGERVPARTRACSDRPAAKEIGRTARGD
jgi:hypothetical protein